MINIFETSFEARDRRFQIEKLYHGETVDLVGVVTTNGVPQNIMGYVVSGVFQPTSMNGSPDFYELSADIVDNKVIVHWEKGKDFGENSYMVWALLTDGDNASYPIAWRLDMAYSPSYPLSSLDPIPKTIDFDKYDLLNAPWLPLSDVQSVKEDVLLSVSEGFLPLSGGTIDGELVVTSEISAQNFTASIARGVSIGDSSVSDNGVVIGFNSGTSQGSVAIGNGIQSDGFGNTNIGLGSKSKGDFGIAIGQATEVSSVGIAIGYDSKASVPGAVAMGTSAKATAKNAIQIGSTVDDGSSWTEQVNSVPHSLKVMDKMVLSGDNLTLDPERVPYLSNYETKADAATEHQTLSADLTAYVDEKISEIPQPQPPPAAGVLTIKQNDDVVVEYNPDDETDITATITVPEVPTDLSAFTNSPGYLTAHQSLSDYYTKQEADGKFLTAHQDLTEYATKAFVQSEISDFVTEDALTGLATKEEVQAVDNKLSDYAEKEELTAYAQLSDIPELPEDIVRKDDLSVYAQLSDLENIDVGEMSACLSSAEFQSESYLPANVFGELDTNAISLEDLGNKINKILQLLKRDSVGPGNADPTKTYGLYVNGTINSAALTAINSVINLPDSGNVVKMKVGTTVTSIGGLYGKSNLTSVIIPKAVNADFNFNTFQGTSTSITFEGRTKEEVKAIGRYSWRLPSGCVIHCSDGDITI